MLKKRLQTAAPLHQQVADRLRESIYNGTLVAGQQIPTEAALIKDHGVSRITIRRAFQELISEGLLVATRGKGTFVNPSAFTGVHNYLFVHGLDYGIGYPTTSAILEGITQQNREQIHCRIEMLGLPPRHLQSDSEHRIEDLIATSSIHGIIGLPRMKPQTLSRVAEKNIPVVQIGGPTPEPPPGGLVVNLDIMVHWARIIEYLTANGRSKIGIIGQPAGCNPDPKEPMVEKTRQAFSSTVLKLLYQATAWGVHGGEQAATTLLAQHPELDALIACDDMQGLGAIRAAQRLGRSVGKSHSLSIISTGNVLGEHSNCGLTTLDLRLQDLGAASVGYLRQMIAGQYNGPRSVDWGCELLIRDTA